MQTTTANLTINQLIDRLDTDELRTGCEILEAMATAERCKRLDDALNHRTKQYTLLLDRIVHEHNTSAIIRTADAFGIAEIHRIASNRTYKQKKSKATDYLTSNQAPELAPTIRPNPVASLKPGQDTQQNSGDLDYANTGIAMGSEKWVNIVEHPDEEAALAHLVQQGYKIVVLRSPLSKTTASTRFYRKARNPEPSNSIIDTLPEPRHIKTLPRTEKLVLVLGNECLGASPGIFNSAHYCVYIPMVGFAESFNVSVAASIALYSLTLRDTSDTPLLPLDENEAMRLKLRWLLSSITMGKAVLEERIRERDEGIQIAAR